MLSVKIKKKTKEFKKLLIKNGFIEAKFYKENYVCKYRFYKETIIDVAFIVNLEVFNNKIEIHYGYASTAFTKMTGCADTLKKYGVDSSDINLRNMQLYSYGDNESLLYTDIKEFYNQYFNFSKDEILTAAKEKKKTFLNKINEYLKQFNFKKKNTTWTRSLEENYYLEFYAQKSQWRDEYYFNIFISKNNGYPLGCYHTRVNTNNKGIYNWQVIMEDNFTELMNSIINNYLLPIINTPICELGKKTEISIGCACDRKKCSSCWIKKIVEGNKY